MNVLSLRKTLLGEVGSLLQPLGFAPKPVAQSFRMPKPFGWAAIHLGFVNHPPTDFDVVVNVAIRVDRVQDVIISKDDPLVADSDRRNSATVGCELGNLWGTGQHRWTIASEQQVRPVAREIVSACQQTLLPFIEKYSDLRTLHDTLAADSKEANLINPFPDERKKVVIILADLLRGS
jgi:hypothetical protein